MMWGIGIHGGYGFTWWPMLLVGLFWIVVVALLVYAAIRIFRPGTPHQPAAPPAPPAPSGDSAEEILARRFATGEIDADEYSKRLELLRSSRPPRA
jgi:putative membrane protein